MSADINALVVPSQDKNASPASSILVVGSKQLLHVVLDDNEAAARDRRHQGSSYYSRDYAHDEGLTLSFDLAIGGETENVHPTYPWPEGGLCLYPVNTTSLMSKELNSKHICIETDINGSYHFPTNTKLVSAIYNIKTGFSVTAKLEFEHCFSGDLSTLAFVYSDSCHPPYYISHPPYQFKVANQEDYQHSFTATHGVIETNHFSFWAIIEWIRGKVYFDNENEDDKNEVHEDQENLRIKMICFYRVEKSHIKVSLAILKELTEHAEVKNDQNESVEKLCDQLTL